MLYRLAVSTALVTLCLSACDRRSGSPAPETAEAPTASTAAAAPNVAVELPPPATAAAAPIVAGAPAYAALYPGGELEGPPTTAEAGAGGLATFRTDATPDAVIAFYRERAEDAGLASVMGMNQGDARAYGARGDGEEGASLQVVAAPTEDGGTSVQVSWSDGA